MMEKGLGVLVEHKLSTLHLAPISSFWGRFTVGLHEKMHVSM